jgi:hypothetical protein
MKQKQFATTHAQWGPGSRVAAAPPSGYPPPDRARRTSDESPEYIYSDSEYESDFEYEEDDFEEYESDADSEATELEVSRVVSNYNAVLGGSYRPPTVPEALDTESHLVKPLPGSRSLESQLAQATRECVERMGRKNFDLAFAFLWEARAREASESEIRRGLTDMVGADLYSKCGFEVDQLVYHQRMKEGMLAN